MAEKVELKNYVLTVCYDDYNVGYTTRVEHFTSDDYHELEKLYRFDKLHKTGCVGCNIRNAKGTLLFGYTGTTKFIT